MNDFSIDVEDDPVPIVRVMAAQFRRYANHPDFVDALAAVNGVFALADRYTPQSVTIRVNDNHMRLDHGVAADAQIVIHANLDNPADKPRVKGLWRHPLFTLRASKLLDDYYSDWRETVAIFWTTCQGFNAMPAAIRFSCTDENAELTLGESEPDVEFHGTASALNQTFGGGAVLVEAMMRGRIRGVCTLEQVARLSEVTKCMMLGDA